MKAKQTIVSFVCALALAVPALALAATSEEASTAKTDATAESAQSEEATGKEAADKEDTTETEATESEKEASEEAEGATPATPSEEILEWAEGLDCESCHTVEADSIEAEDTAMATHAALDMACTDCHMNEILITRHEKVTAESRMPKILKRAKIDDAVCVSCHNPEDLKEATADFEGLVDENGTIVNPHDVPQIEDHADITCTTCHKMHSADAAVEKAIASCTSCHHADVFECGTCH